MTTVINGTSTSASAPAVVGDDGDTGIFFPTANVLAFATNGTEDARFDASGNLLIGQSVDNFPGAGNTITGGGITSTGRISFSTASNTCAYFNRNSTDGELMSFRRQGNGSGNITVSSTGIVIGGVNGVTFTGTQTASADANTLDDYEEGTFTLVFADNTSGGNTKNVAASYTKIGNIVKIRFAAYYETLPTFTAGNQIYMRGLPFSTVGEGCAGSIMLQNSYGTSIPIYAWQPSGQTWFVVKLNDFVTGVVGSNLNGFALTTYGNLIYFTNT